MLNSTMYILSGGERHYIFEGDMKGFWYWKPSRHSDLRYLVATPYDGLLACVDVYEDKVITPVCNICGERPAEYRITDVAEKNVWTISYSCQPCMHWWAKADPRGIKTLVAPIKDYGYGCDHCDKSATDVIQHINAGSFWSAEFICEVHAWRAAMWPMVWLNGVANIIPIEDFLMEGTRWPGK